MSVHQLSSPIHYANFDDDTNDFADPRSVVIISSDDSEINFQSAFHSAHDAISDARNAINDFENAVNDAMNDTTTANAVSDADANANVNAGSDSDSDSVADHSHRSIRPVSLNTTRINNIDVLMDDDECTSTTILCNFNENNVPDIADNYANQDIYEDYLRSFHKQIDDFIDPNATQHIPCNDLVRYANYEWKYTQLTSEDKRRLTRLRFLTEQYNDVRKELDKNTFYDAIEENDQIEDKNPICPICRFDLRNESTHLQHITVTRCGHVYHNHCLKRNIIRHNQNLCCVCNSFVSIAGSRRIYLQFK